MDWKLLITELQDAGVTQVQIAERCGCSQSIISDLATGKQTVTRYEVGDAIRSMHKTRIRKPAKSAPAANGASA